MTTFVIQNVVMNQNEETLITFQTRVRQMILLFQKMKKENEELYAELEKCDQNITELKQEVARREKDYEALKMARMMEISGNDIESAKNRLAHLIRDVNRCIAVLSD